MSLSLSEFNWFEEESVYLKSQKLFVRIVQAVKAHDEHKDKEHIPHKLKQSLLVAMVSDHCMGMERIRLQLKFLIKSMLIFTDPTVHDDYKDMVRIQHPI